MISHNFGNEEFGLWMYLRETALVVQYAQYPMRLSSDEVKTGLVVAEGLLLPHDLLPHVLLLHTKVRQVGVYKTLLTSLFLVFTSVEVSPRVCEI